MTEPYSDSVLRRFIMRTQFRSIKRTERLLDRVMPQPNEPLGCGGHGTRTGRLRLGRNEKHEDYDASGSDDNAVRVWEDAQ